MAGAADESVDVHQRLKNEAKERVQRTSPGVVNPTLLLPSDVDDGRGGQREEKGVRFIFQAAPPSAARVA